MMWECSYCVEGLDTEASCRCIGRMIDESGMTDKELGKKMHLSVQAINKWRHGHNIPDIENLFILSRILGTKVDGFLVPRVRITVAFEPNGAMEAASRRLCSYYTKVIFSECSHKTS